MTGKLWEWWIDVARCDRECVWSGISGHCAKEFSVGLVRSVVFSSRDTCWCSVTVQADETGRPSREGCPGGEEWRQQEEGSGAKRVGGTRTEKTLTG